MRKFTNQEMKTWEMVHQGVTLTDLALQVNVDALFQEEEEVCEGDPLLPGGRMVEALNEYCLYSGTICAWSSKAIVYLCTWRS